MAAPTHQQDQPVKESLIAFESGHYKTVNGRWKGDSVWCHFQKHDGGMVHVNKDKVEYIESFPAGNSQKTVTLHRLFGSEPFHEGEIPKVDKGGKIVIPVEKANKGKEADVDQD